jgi:AcrR family transcriptional regulator
MRGARATRPPVGALEGGRGAGYAATVSRAEAMPPDARRAHLLAASRAVFARKGYHAASVADILEEAAVARGTFYNHFPSKRAAFQAVLDGIMDVVSDAVRPIDPSRSIPDQVRENLIRLVRALSDHGDVPRLLFGVAGGVDEDGEAELRVFYGRALGRIEHALRLGQRFGVVPPTDPALTARCLLGLLKEPAYQASLHGDRLDADALVDVLFSFLTRGVLSVSPAVAAT